MKARLAFFLSRQTKNAYNSFDISHRDLYTFVYPKIYTAIGRGESKVVFTSGFSDDVAQVLVKEGFTIISMNKMGNIITVDWSAANL
jgi:hypothetical protein